MTWWDHIAEAVLPTGMVRSAFARAARERRWREHLELVADTAVFR